MQLNSSLVHVYVNEYQMVMQLNSSLVHDYVTDLQLNSSLVLGYVTEYQIILNDKAIKFTSLLLPLILIQVVHFLVAYN